MPEDINPINLPFTPPDWVGQYELPKGRSLGETENKSDYMSIFSNLMDQSAPKTGQDFPTVSTAGIDMSGRFPTFFPGRDNEEMYAQAQTKLEKAYNGVAKMSGIATTTFLEGTAGLVYGVYKGISDGKISSFYDNELTNTFSDFNKDWENKYAHYKTQRERNGSWWEPENLFTGNFLWDNIVKNLGFSVGAMAAGFTWGGAFKAIGLTSKLAGAGAEMAAAADTAIAEASLLPQAQRLPSMVSKLESLWNTTKVGVGKGLMKADQGIVATFGTVGEAGLEALGNSQEFRQRMISEFVSTHGYNPTTEDLKQINDYAESVGNSTLFLNTALLTVTNYIQLPKIYSSSFKSEKNIINNIKFDAGKYADALPQKGFGKFLYKSKNVASLFFNTAEAFEEGAQFAIQTGTQNYFSKKYRKQQSSVLDDGILFGVEEALTSDEGLLNIATGGLSGALQSAGLFGLKKNEKGQTRPTLFGTGKIGERGFTGYGGEEQKLRNEAISALNGSLIKDKLKSAYSSVKASEIIQQERENTIRQGDVLESKDLEFDYAHNFITNRLKYNAKESIDFEIESLKKEAATEEGFATLQRQGYTAETDTRKSFIDRLNNLQEHANNAAKLNDAANIKYKGLVDKKTGKRLYSDDVISKLVYAASKVKDYDDRIPQLSAELFTSGINVQGIIDDILLTRKPNKLATQEALETINKIGGVNKDELKTSLKDVIELSLRRAQFLKEYDEIKENPSAYDTPEADEEVKPISKVVVKQTGDEENKTVNKEIELGKSYSLKQAVRRDGNALQLSPKISVISKTLGGEYEVKLPNGQTTYLTPEQFKDYDISDVEIPTAKISELLDKAIDNVLNTKKHEIVVKPTENKLDYINKLNNKELVDDVEQEFNKLSEEYLKELADEISRKERLLKNAEQLRKTQEEIEKLSGDVGTNDDEFDTNLASSFWEDMKKAAARLFTSTTTASEDWQKENLPPHIVRFNTFTNKFKDFKNKSKLKVILVTSVSQKDLGLDGLAELSFETGGDKSLLVNKEQYDKLDEAKKKEVAVSGFVSAVVVEVGRNGAMYYVNSNGERIKSAEGKDIEVSQPAPINEVVFSTMPAINLYYSNGNARYRASEKEAATKYAAAWEIYRRKLFEKDNKTATIFDFAVSKGVGLVNKTDPETNFVGSLLIDNDKLATQTVIVVSTKGAIAHEDGNNYRFANGRPVFKNADDLVYLNNSRFSKNKAKSIFAVIKQWSDEVNRQAMAGEAISVSEKYSKFLQSVLYWNSKAESAPSANKIYLNPETGMLHVGSKENGVIVEKTYDFANIGKYEAELVESLQNSYHNVNNKTLSEGVAEPFTELYLDERGELKERVWVNYQSYLLSSINPDGSKRLIEDAPLFTNISKPTDAVPNAIKQKYLVLQGMDLPIQDIKPKGPVEEEEEEIPGGPITKIGEFKVGKGQVNKFNIKAIGKDVEFTIDINEKGEPEVTLISSEGNAIAIDAILANAEITTAIKEGLKLNNSFEEGKDDKHHVTKGVPTVIKAKLMQILREERKDPEGFGKNPPDPKLTRKEEILNKLKSIKSNVLGFSFRTTAPGTSRWTKDGKKVTFNSSDRDKYGRGGEIFTINDKYTVTVDYKRRPTSGYSRSDEELPFDAEYSENPKALFDELAALEALDSKDDKTDIEKLVLTEEKLQSIKGTLRVDLGGFSIDNLSKEAYDNLLHATTDPFYKGLKEWISEYRKTQKPFAVVDSSEIIEKYLAVPVVSDIEAKKADIKRREKEDISNILEKSNSEENWYELKVDHSKRNTVREGLSGKYNNYNDLVAKINAKYNAELAALEETKPAEQPSNTQDITDDFTDINHGEEFRRVGVDTESEPMSEAEIEFFKKFVAEKLPGIPYEFMENLIRTFDNEDAYGSFEKGMMKIYKKAAKGTAFHELMEGVWLGFLSPQKQRAILEEFKSKKGSFIDRASGRRIDFNEATDLEAKERIMDDFSEFMDGKIPAKSISGQILQWFKSIIDYIKSLVSKGSFKDQLFRDVYTGKFKKSVFPKVKLGAPIQYKEVEGVSQRKVNDFVQDITARIFRIMFSTKRSLFNIEDITANDIFEKIKNDYTKAGYFNKISEKTFNDLVDRTKDYLRTFNIEFDDNGNVGINDEGSNNKDYAAETFSINFKKSSPYAVKLLISSLFKTGKINQQSLLLPEDVKIDRSESSVNGFVLVPFGQSFNILMNKLNNVLDKDDFVRKLYELAVENSDYIALFKRLGGNFGSGDPKSAGKIDFSKYEEHDWRLFTSFYQVFTKQLPDGMMQYFDNDQTYNASANQSRAIDQVVSEWSSNMKELADKPDSIVKFNEPKRFYEVDKSSDAYKAIKVGKPSEMVSFLEKIGISFPITTYNKLRKDQLETFANAVNGIKTGLDKSGVILSIKNKNKDFDITGNLNSLSELYVKAESPNVETSFFNNAGKQQQAFTDSNAPSVFESIFNSVENLTELKQRMPQLNDVFSTTAQILKPGGLFFDEDGDRREGVPLKVQYTLGTLDKSDNEGLTISELSRGKRKSLEINQNLKGSYYIVIPGDGSTEWMMNLGNQIVYKDFVEGRSSDKVNEIFQGYLKDEIALAKDAVNRKKLKYVASKASQLRFFKELLPKGLVEKVDVLIANKNASSKEIDKFIEDNAVEINASIEKFINSTVDETIRSLKYNGEIVSAPNNKFNYKNLDTNIARSFGITASSMTEEQLKTLLTFANTNFVINNIEYHKVIFGDPYQFKITEKDGKVILDETKRVKSFLSPRKITLSFDEMNNWLNSKLNSVGTIPLTEKDYGYHKYKNYLKTFTAKDVYIVGSLSSRFPAYAKTNEADAASWITPEAWKEVKYKNGQWDDKAERFHQWQMAYTRQNIPGYVYTNEALREMDAKITSYPCPIYVIEVLKPIVTGVKFEKTSIDMVLDKFSQMPMYYQAVKGTNLESLYIKMFEGGYDYVVVESGRKVGIEDMHSLYKPNGDFNDAALNNTIKVPWSIYGIQVENSYNKEKLQPLGSQLTKMATIDLFEDGEAIGATPERKEIIKKAVQRNVKTLSELSANGYKEFLKKLGIEDLGDGFKIINKTVIANTLRQEILKRELSDNGIDSITINPITGEFEIPFEASPNYKQIKDILYSIVDKHIASPKVNGFSAVQVAATMWEKSGKGRQLVQKIYFKKSADNALTEVTKEEYDELPKLEKATDWKKISGETYETLSKEQQADVQLTSDALKFYEDEDGKRYCEVMLPNWFRRKLPKGKFKTDEELITYLNTTAEGKKILSGIGFRIPTQAINSVEVFRVKEFLPDFMGRTVVVPSEITTKSGSDFDIDKLNMYLKNVYVTPSGEIKLVPFFGFGQQAIDKMKEFIFQEDIKAVMDIYEEVTGDREDDYGELSEKLYKQSLENEYYDSLDELLTFPENFERVVAPNTSDDLEALASEISDLLGEDESNVKNRLLDRNFMSDLRHTYITAKRWVGRAAVNITNHSLAQKEQIYVKAPSFKIALPHNSVIVDGYARVSLSGRIDKAGKYISDKLSMYANSFVDVVKDPYIMKIIYSDRLVSTFMFLERAGVPMRHVGLFMSQPIIKEYVNMLDAEDVSSFSIENEEILLKLAKMFPTSNTDLTKASIDSKEASLANNISKYYKNKQTLTSLENAEQRLLLEEFIKYYKMGDGLFKITQATNYDTTSFKSADDLYRKQVMTELISGVNPISSPSKILNSSHIGALAKFLDKADEALGEVLKFNRREFRNILEKVISQYARNQYLSKDKFTRVAAKLSASFLDYIIQTKMSTLDLKSLTVDSNSVANRIQAAKVIYPNIQILKDFVIESSGLPGGAKTVKLRVNLKEAYDENLYIGYMREMRSYGPLEDLYKDLIKLAIIQGNFASAVSIKNIVPLEDYAAIVAPIMKTLVINDVINQFHKEAMFQRNNWKDKNIVPKTRPSFYLEEGSDTFDPFITFDEYGEYIYQYSTKAFPEKPNLGLGVNQRQVMRLHPKAKGASNSVIIVPRVITVGEAKSMVDFITGETVTKSEFAIKKQSGDTSITALYGYKRIEDNDGEPLLTSDGYYIYKQINLLGDGQYASEYKLFPTKSPINNGTIKVEQEIPDLDIISEFFTDASTFVPSTFIDPLQPAAKQVSGVEISSNSKGLAAALTNPTELAKSKGNLTESYPVEFEAVTYPDAEATYQAMKKYATKDEGPKSTYNLMVSILKAKLQQYPRLVSEITKQGGSSWILSSTHQPTKQNSVWETGGKNWFIKSLNDAYLDAVQAPKDVSGAPKGEMVKEGIYVNQEGLTKEEQLELFDYLKPFLESQGKKTNKGANAPIMIGLGLRWDYKSNNPNLTPVNIGNNLAGGSTSYAYYDLSINGKTLGKITPRFVELMNKSTGIDISNYDGAIINLYSNGSLIGNHSDLEESATAEKYPVVVANIGGTGNIILGNNQDKVSVELKAGAAYLFGHDGKNRKIQHSTYASEVKGFLPSITVAQEGKTFNQGDYRVSITMRRVMPLEPGMPASPTINSQPKQPSVKTRTEEFSEFGTQYRFTLEGDRIISSEFKQGGREWQPMNSKNAVSKYQALSSKKTEIDEIDEIFGPSPVVKEGKTIFESRNTPLEYTSKQTKALADIQKLIDANKQGYYLLAGYAGTGKTTIAENIAVYAMSQGRPVLVLAPTNKATKVLGDKFKKAGVPSAVSTIHSAIYGEPDPNTGEWKPKANLKNHVIIVDESSMIEDSVMNDLLNNTKKNNILIFMGDGFQLEPVGEDSGLFADKIEQIGSNKSELTEVRRQAFDSNVLKLATLMRTDNKAYVPTTSVEDVKVSKSRDEFINDFKQSIKNNEDVIMIVATNNERLAMNTVARMEKFGPKRKVINDGEVLAAVANSSDIANSEIFKVGSVQDEATKHELTFNFGNKTETFDMYLSTVTLANGDQVKLMHFPQLNRPSLYHEQILQSMRQSNRELFETLDNGSDIIYVKNKAKLSSAIVISTYGYAVTAHKSQGSQWSKVFVNQNYSAPTWNPARWFYTAVTRSAKDVVILPTSYNTKINPMDMNARIDQIAKESVPLDSITLKDGSTYNKIDVYASMLENKGYTPEEIGKLLQSIC